MRELEALGVEVVPLGKGWAWDADGGAPAARSRFGGLADNGPAGSTLGTLSLVLSHESTVRIARAD
jgi:hypothetical protein